jgi:hypothetical protein
MTHASSALHADCRQDPRFVWTLHHWGPVLTKLAFVPTPLLIHVRRDLSDVATSYRRRNETCFQVLALMASDCF